MKFSDLLRMSGSNLLRRKLRTALTVLGVVIGTASIVVMISLGLGLQKSSLEQIEQYGGLTTINVNTWGNYNSDSSQEELRIDDGVVETISKIPHVEFASPILSTYVLLKQGVYEGSLTVQGMTQEALQNMDMKVGEGTLPEAGAPLSFFYGNQVITNFYNPAKFIKYRYCAGLIRCKRCQEFSKSSHCMIPPPMPQTVCAPPRNQKAAVPHSIAHSDILYDNIPHLFQWSD